MICGLAVDDGNDVDVMVDAGAARRFSDGAGGVTARLHDQNRLSNKYPIISVIVVVTVIVAVVVVAAAASSVVFLCSCCCY
jgi:hypothetical protein